MVWCLHFALPSLFILSHFNMDRLHKFFLSFQFDLKIFFLSDLVIIKEQLILNSYDKMRFEEEGPK